MYSKGFNYWLTKHGRQRFLERVKNNASDSEILKIAVNGLPGYNFIWAPDKRYPTSGRRLVTVLFNQSEGESSCTGISSSQYSH